MVPPLPLWAFLLVLGASVPVPKTLQLYTSPPTRLNPRPTAGAEEDTTRARVWQPFALSPRFVEAGFTEFQSGGVAGLRLRNSKDGQMVACSPTHKKASSGGRLRVDFACTSTTDLPRFYQGGPPNNPDGYPPRTSPWYATYGYYQDGMGYPWDKPRSAEFYH